MNAAVDGDVIYVREGVSTARVELAQRSVSLVGVDGADATVIDACPAGVTRTVSNGQDGTTRIQGFTLQHGADETIGSGLTVQSSSPALADLVVRDCSGVAAIHLDDSDSSADGVRLLTNGTTSGILTCRGAPTFTHVPATNNSLDVCALQVANSDAAVGNSIFAFNDLSWHYGALSSNSVGRGAGRFSTTWSPRRTLLPTLVPRTRSAKGVGK